MLDDKNILFLNYTYFSKNEINNEFLEHNYKQFVIEYEDIKDNFKKIYANYLNFYKRIIPVFEIYLDNLDAEPSNMNKFLNYNQIIEYISKEFDEKNAKTMWLKNGSPSNKITLSDRIESIIQQVNFVWNFRKNKIHDLSRKIADGRNYYNHHTNPIKKLSNEELFRFSYFLEDVILSYIYLTIGIDKYKIKSALKYNIYYNKMHLK